MKKNVHFDYRIWGLALGYFAFYIPYSALAKALSMGILPGMESRVAGFELLPATIIATVITTPVIITLLGWWKYADRAKMLGLSIPVPSPSSIVSGLAFALIIATTTLAYTFEGISIVFALLLMRGGVLILAPIVDKLFHKKVGWYSWGALALSFVALAVALSDVDSYQLGIAAMINLALYLSGYFFRLRRITGSGKSEFEHTNYRYFVEEQMVAMPVLIAVPGVVALVGTGAIAEQLRSGFTTFLFSNLAPPALLVGALYAVLGAFGTLIYLNRRENSFSIPVNRCSSLLSGVVAAYALMVTLNQSPPRASQLVSAAIILGAIFLLSARTLTSREYAERLVLFLCDGNRARSPMAEAICNAAVGPLGEPNGDTTLRAVSAGLNMKLGAAMRPDAVAALATLGVVAGRHAAKGVTADMVERAHVIFCFTEEQRATLVSRHPAATGKARRLDPHADIPEPRVGDAAHFEQVATAIRARVRVIVADPAIVDLPG